jgi:FMN-dependent NADH-azoreductase
MKNLLIVNSSPRSQSVSRRLTRHFVEEWMAKNPDTKVVERDLAAEALPFLSENWIQAAYTPAGQRTAEQEELLRISDAVIGEVMAADVIVLGVPMHNFSVPASLKAWIDQIARVGETFSYGDSGPKGLVPSGKIVIAIVSRGAPYVPDSPMAAMDFQVPYLQQVLGFMGLTDITFIHADKQGLGSEVAQRAVDQAVKSLSALVGSYAQAQVSAA